MAMICGRATDLECGELSLHSRLRRFVAKPVPRPAERAKTGGVAQPNGDRSPAESVDRSAHSKPCSGRDARSYFFVVSFRHPLGFWPFGFLLSFGIRNSDFRPLLALLLLLATLLPSFAHLPSLAAATATIEPDGKYSLDLTFDVPPFALNVLPQNATEDAMNAWLDGSTNALAVSLSSAQSRF